VAGAAEGVLQDDADCRLVVDAEDGCTHVPLGGSGWMTTRHDARLHIIACPDRFVNRSLEGALGLLASAASR
jgi:hypothetical protein